MSRNIFSSLSKYSSAYENYLTEALVFLMRLLLERSPTLGLSLVNLFCDGSGGVCFIDPSSVSISTQVTGEEGTPDIEIRDGVSTLVYVEVKHDSPLGVDQLERYRAELRRSGIPDTLLTLLTRSRSASLGTSLSPAAYNHVCWYEIYNWLCAADSGDDVIDYFIGSFMGFLEEKNMSMKKVGWEYIEGVPAMLRLIGMLEAALTDVSLGDGLTRTSGWGWRGFYVLGDYFCGIRYDLPLVVVFESNRGNHPVTFKVDLDLDQVHFFSLAKDEQLECIATFVKQAVTDATSSSGTAHA